MGSDNPGVTGSPVPRAAPCDDGFLDLSWEHGTPPRRSVPCIPVHDDMGLPDGYAELDVRVERGPHRKVVRDLFGDVQVSAVGSAKIAPSCSPRSADVITGIVHRERPVRTRGR